MLTAVKALLMAEPVSGLARAGMVAHEADLLLLYMVWCMLAAPDMHVVRHLEMLTRSWWW